MATYDWAGTDIIPNGSGSAVRADLNDAFLALFSQNSSATAPTTTVGYMLWADSNAGYLKIRDSSNPGLWYNLFTLTGEWSPLKLVNGTAAAPSLQFTSSGTDTGLYSPGIDQVAITTAGVQRVNFNGSTEVVFNDGGADVDFRIEGDTKPNLFKVDAGTDAVSIDGDFSVTGNLSGTIRQSTAVASTSGTAIDFTSIPSWVKRVTVMFQGVSTSGTSQLLIRLGTGSGPAYVSTGYIGYAFNTSSNAAAGASVTSGVPISNSPVATGNYSGMATIATLGSNAWAATSYLGGDNTQGTGGGGSISLGAALTAIRITTVNGTDTFDAGSINILYEG